MAGLSGVAEYRLLLMGSAAKEVEAFGSKEDLTIPRSSLATTTDTGFVKATIEVFTSAMTRAVMIFEVGHRKAVYRR